MPRPRSAAPRSQTSRSEKDQPARFRSEFGAALEAQLTRRGTTQVDLAAATGTSRAYVNQTITGSKPASARWVSLVAEVIGATQEEKRRLSNAAARDHGFDVGKDPPPAADEDR